MRTSIKPEFVQGESLSWEKSFTDHKPADGWSLEYVFRGSGAGFDLTATDGGAGKFVLSASSDQTTQLAPGTVYFQAFVRRGSERILVDSGSASVIAGLAAQTNVDGRTQIKRTLDAIDALIEGKASLDQLEYTIGDRQLRRYSMTELIVLREKYAQLYARELRAARIKRGGTFLKNYHIRFNQPK